MFLKILPVISLLLTGSLASADTPVRQGPYTTATESDAVGSAFELKADGKASVTVDVGEGSTSKTLSGNWKSIPGGIELSYGNVTDQLILEAQCRGWPEYYCLRFKKTVKGGKTKFEVTDKPFINWDWKYAGPKVVHKLSKKCIDQCTKMQKDGELKEDMDVQACGEAICED
jgi:hypothetical protein